MTLRLASLNDEEAVMEHLAEMGFEREASGWAKPIRKLIVDKHVVVEHEQTYMIPKAHVIKSPVSGEVQRTDYWGVPLGDYLSKNFDNTAKMFTADEAAALLGLGAKCIEA